jgi:predicted MFS family arabinose efflux permease
VVVAGPGGGYLASINFGWTCGICGGVMLVLVPATLLFLYELRRRTDSSRVLAAAGEQLTRIGTAGTMWAAAGLIAFFYMAPGLITALFYKQQNELHMTTQGQGFLSLLGGIGGISATIVYGFACQRFSLRTMLLASISMAAVLTPALLFYNSVLMAQIIAAGAGFFGILVLLALMDLAVRATPRGSESLGYSLLVSVYNLVRFGADWVGSLLLDKYHFQFSWLVWANVATAVLAIPLVLLMPRVLVRSRDGERAEDLAEAAEGMPAAAEAVATG